MPSTLAHTSLIQTSIFLHARTPQSNDCTMAVPGGRLWHAAGQLTVHARSTVTITSPTAPRACRPVKLRDRSNPRNDKGRQQSRVIIKYNPTNRAATNK